MKKYKIIFCGLDEKLFQLLTEDTELDVIAVNLIVELGCFKSINPVDMIFKITYNNIVKKSYHLSLILFFLLMLLHKFGSNLTKKYYSYLKILINKKISILDFNQTISTVD